MLWGRSLLSHLDKGLGRPQDGDGAGAEVTRGVQSVRGSQSQSGGREVWLVSEWT